MLIFTNVAFQNVMEALKMRNKEHDVSILYVFSYKNNLIFSIYSIEIKVEIAQVGLISSFRYNF